MLPGSAQALPGQGPPPPTLPPNLPNHPPMTSGEEPPMPVLKPEKAIEPPIDCTTFSGSGSVMPGPAMMMGGDRKVPPSPAIRRKTKKPVGLKSWLVVRIVEDQVRVLRLPLRLRWWLKLRGEGKRKFRFNRVRQISKAFEYFSRIQILSHFI